jgi:hypothetical protein
MLELGPRIVALVKGFPDLESYWLHEKSERLRKTGLPYYESPRQILDKQKADRQQRIDAAKAMLREEKKALEDSRALKKPFGSASSAIDMISRLAGDRRLTPFTKHSGISVNVVPYASMERPGYSLKGGRPPNNPDDETKGKLAVLTPNDILEVFRGAVSRFNAKNPRPTGLK